MEVLAETHSVSIERSAGRLRLVVKPSLHQTVAVDAVDTLYRTKQPVETLRCSQSTTEFILDRSVTATDDGFSQAHYLTGLLDSLGVQAYVVSEPQIRNISI